MSRLINNILNEESKKSITHFILKDVNKISVDYVPEFLPHRDNELSKLVHQFKEIINNFDIEKYESKAVLVIGEKKTGKTVTLRRFGYDLEKYFQNKKGNLKIHFYYRHVNCIRYRTVYSIFISVIQSFVPEFPIRGFSTFELIKYLKEYLEASNSYLLLTLDDIDALNGDKDYDTILISLINNEIENFDIYKKRISLVIISNNKMYLNSINNLSASQLLQNIIFFQSYSREQLYYILIFRAQETLIEQTWTENDIEKIIQIVEEQNYGFYDPRIGLEILWRVARESEANKKSKLTVDNFKFYDKVPFEDSKIELSLKIQEKVLLYIIAKIFLKNQNQSFTTIKEIKREFDKIKASLKIPFTKLGYTSIFNYLQELKKLNLIITQVTNAQTRGRSTIIKLNILPNHVDVLLQNQLLK